MKVLGVRRTEKARVRRVREDVRSARGHSVVKAKAKLVPAALFVRWGYLHTYTLTHPLD